MVAAQPFSDYHARKRTMLATVGGSGLLVGEQCATLRAERERCRQCLIACNMRHGDEVPAR